MTKPDLRAAMETLAQSEETVRKSRAICDASKYSLEQGRRTLAAASASQAQIKSALAVFRRELS